MRDYHRLKLLMNFCLKNKKGKVLGVRTARKKLIFALFLIETHGSKTIGFMLETPESVTRKINYFVINELIRTYSSSKAILDLAGAGAHLAEPPEVSFGCTKTNYFRICRNRLMWPFEKIM